MAKRIDTKNYSDALCFILRIVSGHFYLHFEVQYSRGIEGIVNYSFFCNANQIMPISKTWTLDIVI